MFSKSEPGSCELSNLVYALDFNMHLRKLSLRLLKLAVIAQAISKRHMGHVHIVAKIEFQKL